MQLSIFLCINKSIDIKIIFGVKYLQYKEKIMGLFGIKKQLLKVIEWKDDSKDTVVYRYPLTDRDAMCNFYAQRSNC